MTRIALIAFIAFLACTHGDPYTANPGDSVGPFTPDLPRQLTFNPDADVTASATGDTVVFSRAEETRTDGDYCLALLPLEGGRLHAVRCAGGAVADTVQDIWTYPVVSPDRRRVAYVRERFVIASGRFLARQLVIAPFAAPDSPTVMTPGAYDLPAGGLGNAFHAPAWVDDGTVRFLGGLETSGSNASFEPGGVFEVLVDGNPTPSAIPELADAVAFAQREDGGVYFLSDADPTGVFEWLPGGTPALAATFDCGDGSPLAELTAVAAGTGGVAVVATCLTRNGPESRLLWTVPGAGGAPSWLPLPFQPQRVAGVPGRPRLIVEAAGDLWLVGIP